MSRPYDRILWGVAWALMTCAAIGIVIGLWWLLVKLLGG